MDIFIPKIKSIKKLGVYSGCDEITISHILTTALSMPYFLQTMGTIQCPPEEVIENVSYFLFAAINFNKKMVPNFGKNNRILSQTRKKILAVSKKEFSEKGYLETSVSKIAKKAGFSRGTFYQHFKDKDDLVRNIFFDILSPITPFSGLSGEVPDNFGVFSMDNLEKVFGTVYEEFNTVGALKWTFLQSIYCSSRLNDNLRDFLINYSRPIIIEIEKVKLQGKCRNVNSSIISQIILTVVGYMAFMTTTNMIQCSKLEFSFCMSRVLYSFLNFTPNVSL